MTLMHDLVSVQCPQHGVNGVLELGTVVHQEGHQHEHHPQAAVLAFGVVLVHQLRYKLIYSFF